MADVEIERLSLQVPGLAPEQGRRLAEMVAKRLAEARLTPARNLDHVHIEMAARRDGESLEQLAGAIADEIRRSMA
jgi:hypothetical protein